MIEKFIPEAYPKHILLKLKAKRILPPKNSSEKPAVRYARKLIFERLRLWEKEVLTVSFKGGSNTLHDKIAKTASTWSQFANIKFDFGFNEHKKTYRHWQNKDNSDIRIGFEEPGYWSFIGTEAVDPDICPPGEISLNLQGFDRRLPSDWSRVILHEFGHALGFHHEHQTQALLCDFNYESLYTYMHEKYGWKKEEVDFNLNQLSGTGYEFSAHDRESIMHYSFPAAFYESGSESPCYIDGENHILSDTDKVMAESAYPFNNETAILIKKTYTDTLDLLRAQRDQSLESLTDKSLDLEIDLETLKIKVIKAILIAGGFHPISPEKIDPAVEISNYITTNQQRDAMYVEIKRIILAYNPNAEIGSEDMEDFEIFKEFIDYAAEKS